MKKLAIALSLVLLCAAPSWAGGVGVGITTWDTESADNDEGFAFRAAFDVGEAVDFEVRASFLDAFSQVGNGALFRLEATPVDFGLAYSFGGSAKVGPYVGAGGTFVYTDAQFEGGLEPATGRVDIKDEFGYYLVVGADFGMSDKWAFYAEAMYRVVKGEVRADGFDFTDFEVDFAGPSGTLGLMLSW